MRKKYTLSFHEAQVPITNLDTKFGGDPVWHTVPQWPLSRSLGTPLQFIGQIVLYPEIFGNIKAKVAYVFINSNDAPNGSFPLTWEVDSGENAVILQPGHCTFPTAPLYHGPTLHSSVTVGNRTIDRLLEFSVALSYGEDPDHFYFTEDSLSDEETSLVYWKLRHEDKIGGSFVHNILGPSPPINVDEFKLVLQLSEIGVDENRPQLGINFGTDGVGYVFISNEGDECKFFWQRD
jgi:hypothetical protein